MQVLCVQSVSSWVGQPCFLFSVVVVCLFWGFFWVLSDLWFDPYHLSNSSSRVFPQPCGRGGCDTDVSFGDKHSTVTCFCSMPKSSCQLLWKDASLRRTESWTNLCYKDTQLEGHLVLRPASKNNGSKMSCRVCDKFCILLAVKHTQICTCISGMSICADIAPMSVSWLWYCMTSCRKAELPLCYLCNILWIFN